MHQRLPQGSAGSDTQEPLVLLSNNIAASQIKHMADISEWTYFIRKKGLVLSAVILSAFGLLFLGIYAMMNSANEKVHEYLVDYTTDNDLKGNANIIFPLSPASGFCYDFTVTIRCDVLDTCNIHPREVLTSIICARSIEGESLSSRP